MENSIYALLYIWVFVCGFGLGLFLCDRLNQETRKKLISTSRICSNLSDQNLFLFGSINRIAKKEVVPFDEAVNALKGNQIFVLETINLLRDQ